MQLKKNDFIEIEFTGKANNEIFDTTNKEEAKSIGLNADVKPVIVSVGNEMLLKALDDALEGKEIGKKHSVHINSEKAFGKRNPSLIKTIPMRIFKEKNINPYPGLVVQMDDYLAKILSVSGGRVIVDFNNPLAGKDIDYDFNVLRKIEDDKEKINALQDFFFRQRFLFEINEKDKKVFFKEEKIKPFLEIFKNKFKEMTGFEFEVAEQSKSKEEKVKEDKKELKEEKSNEKKEIEEKEIK